MSAWDEVPGDGPEQRGEHQRLTVRHHVRVDDPRAKGCGDLGAEECADKVERCRHDDRDAGAEHLGGNHRGDGVGAVVGSVGEVEDQRHHDNEHKQHGDLKHT